MLVVALGACASRPSIPDPDLSGLEPRVAAVLSQARAALVADPDSADAWGELGSLYDAHLFTDLAVRCYRQAHAMDPKRFDWIYLLAIAREIQGAPADELIERFGAASSLAPDYAPVHVRLGDALWRRGRLAEAESELERAIALDPGLAMAQRRLGQVLLSRDDPQSAAKHLARAVTLEPADLAAYTGLAQALMRLGQTERARAIRERAVGLEPVTNLDDEVYAERVFLRNVSSSAAFARATAAARHGDYSRAVSDLEIVLGVRPEDASAQYWMGFALLRSGETDRAIDHLTRAVELDPALARGQAELGRALAERGDHAGAIEHLERAAALEPLDAEGHRWLARAYEAEGRVREAQREYAAAAAAAAPRDAAPPLGRTGSYRGVAEPERSSSSQ